MPRGGKTHSGAAKRFKVTKRGKLKHSKTCRRHLLTNKGRATKRGKYGKLVTNGAEKQMKRLLPTSGR